MKFLFIQYVVSINLKCFSIFFVVRSNLPVDTCTFSTASLLSVNASENNQQSKSACLLWAHGFLPLQGASATFGCETLHFVSQLTSSGSVHFVKGIIFKQPFLLLQEVDWNKELLKQLPLSLWALPSFV